MNVLPTCPACDEPVIVGQERAVTTATGSLIHRACLTGLLDDESARVDPPVRVFIGLQGPVDEPAYFEMCSTRGWACQFNVHVLEHLRTNGTVGEGRIAGAAAFEDERRRVWARAAGLA